MAKLFLTLASLNGFLSVAVGAFGAHALERMLAADAFSNTQRYLDVFETGVRYQMFHTMALFVTALLLLRFPERKLLQVCGWLFVLGICFFSGSLYILALSQNGAWGAVTPIGGLFFLVAWGLLSWICFGFKTGVTPQENA